MSLKKDKMTFEDKYKKGYVLVDRVFRFGELIEIWRKGKNRFLVFPKLKKYCTEKYAIRKGLL